MPTILDSFVNKTSAYIGVVGSHGSGGEKTHEEARPPNELKCSPLGLETA